MFDLLAFLVFALGIVFFVRFFLFTPFVVVGQSMSPTFEQSDLIIVDKRPTTYQKGDVVVFLPPEKDVAYIKRIIAVPGETVKFADGVVSVCDTAGSCAPISEPYLGSGVKTIASCNKQEFLVTSGYFVMGDNRSHSTDSRCCFGFGCYQGGSYTIDNSRILGKVGVRLFPHFSTHF